MFRNPADNDAVRINNSNTNENNVGQIRSRVIDPNILGDKLIV